MRKPAKRFAQIVKQLLDVYKRIRQAFKRFTQTILNGCYTDSTRFPPLNGKALVSVFAFQVTNSI